MQESAVLKSSGLISEWTRSKEQLETELAEANLLHRLSIELIQENDTAGLYKKIVDAAVTIMGSQYGSMQMLCPDDESLGKLHLLASYGFTPEAEKYWEWVYRHTGSSCGAALRAQGRVVVPNFATSEFMQEKPTLPIFLEAGIYASQSTPLFSRDGKLLGMISTHWDHPHYPAQRHLNLLDILARQAADLIERTQTAEALAQSEERLRALTEELEEKVVERTRELQRSNEDLLQFAHVASHDLKEPIRKIRTYALRLKDELNLQESAKCNDYNEKILESAKRMSTMVEGVLTYSSLNGLEQEIETLDLNKTLTDIQNDLEVLIEQKGATIQCGELPNVDGVQVLIYQLFYNLINNSLKFSKENRTAVIDISAKVFSRSNSDFVKITIADNGIGFDPEHNEIIFNTFSRLNSKGKYDGTGLGLSLARKIVERHRGTIEANGMPDEGATFIITLPILSV
jgi:signal transduction histidine kinase